MGHPDVKELKNEYNLIIVGYLDSEAKTLEEYIFGLPYETRMRLYKIEEVLKRLKAW